MAMDFVAVLKLISIFSISLARSSEQQGTTLNSDDYLIEAFSKLDEGKCATDQFFCDAAYGGRCIPAQMECDGQPDCLDESDESPSCANKENKKICPPETHFLCRLTGVCVPLTFICDGKVDCGVTINGIQDSSDETILNFDYPAYVTAEVLSLCKKRTEERRQVCGPNFHKCRTNDQCILIENFCDGRIDCSDLSDEGEFCSNIDGPKPNCTYGSKRTPPDNKPRCYCPKGLVPQGSTCIDEDECENSRPCDQLCINTPRDFSCDCVSGYELHNKTVCKAVNVPKTENSTILLTNAGSILHQKFDSVKIYDKIEGRNIRAMDFDHRNRSVCWVVTIGIEGVDEKTVVQCASVDRFFKNSTWIYEPETNLENVEQMAKDWISGNWYLIHDDLPSLLMCNWNFSACILLPSGEKLSKTKDLALDPLKGFAFIVEFHPTKSDLIRLNLDGSNPFRFNLFSADFQPFTLTLDLANEQIFYLDVYLESIYSIDYQAKNKRRLVSTGHYIKMLNRLTIFETFLYATDHYMNHVWKISTKNSSTSVKSTTNKDFFRADTIRIFHRQKQPEGKHPCSSNAGGCDHFCIVGYLNRTPVAKCACKNGYKLENSTKCILALVYPFLMFGKTHPGSIIGLPMENFTFQAMKPIQNLYRPTSFDYLHKTGEIFFVDGHSSSIKKQKVNNNTYQVVLNLGLGNCEGIALDWTSSNLYWSDEGFTTINVLKIGNSSIRRVVASGNMSHPRALAVDPSNGLLFWSDWVHLWIQQQPTIQEISTKKSAKIERSNLDGSDRRPIVSTAIYWPNGIALDRRNQILYWCDALFDQVESVKYDGSQRKVIIGKSYLGHPYGLALHENFLFVTEFKNGKLLRFDLKNKDENLTTIYEDSVELFEVHVYDPKIQSEMENACSKNNGGCQHFCFFVDFNVKCSCDEKFLLNDDNSTCILNENFTKNAQICPFETHFKCESSDFCFEKLKLCDGNFDCSDQSDENPDFCSKIQNFSKTSTCRPDQFACYHNHCIPEAFRCDGDSDCKQGEDEFNCTQIECPKNKFQCLKSKKCILKDWVCDREPDCGDDDASDEPNTCPYAKCWVDDFECHNRQCIKLLHVCDGEKDCADGSDETNCHLGCKPGQEFRCDDSSPCISKWYKCDGFLDCPNGMDEKNCDRRSTSSPAIAADCSSVDQFRCVSDGRCIRSVFRCDGDRDCMDGSDELGCQSNLSCDPKSQIRCRDGRRCILKAMFCDGFADCQDGSDEREEQCSKISREEKFAEDCPFPNFHCQDARNESMSRCVSIERFCDGKRDCMGGADEGPYCQERACQTRKNLCDHICHNAPGGYVCSCREGFFLMDDRKTCSRYDPCSNWGVCSQYCSSDSVAHYCHCSQGYELMTDKFTCKSTDPVKPYMIFSNRNEVRIMGLHEDMSTPLASNLRNPIAIDFFYDKEYSFIFWTDIATDKIYRGTLIRETLSDIRPIVEQGVSTAEGIAVDWVNENLYWIDSSLDQIEVSKLDGRFRTIVVSGHMQNLRAVCLDPNRGYLFWTDWEETRPRIERSTLAGKNRVRDLFLVSKIPGGGWPNGLTLDYFAQRVYWIDAKSDSIHTIMYDGSDHRQIIRGHDYLSHPFSVVIFDNDVFWTDWRVNYIAKANKWNGTDVRIFHGTMSQPFDVKILHSSRQPRSAKNPCQSMGCSHLCLMNGNTTAICKCPYLMSLSTDRKTCTDLKLLLVISYPTTIMGLIADPPFENAIPIMTNVVIDGDSSVDLDTKSKMIYWHDAKSNAVKRSFLNGSGTEIVIDSGLSDSKSIAVDSTSGNLYFLTKTNPLSGPKNRRSNASIAVSTLDGQFRRLLIDPDRNEWTNRTFDPVSIAIDKIKKHIYWIERGTMKGINRANLDGSDVELLKIDDLVYPKNLYLHQEYLSWIETSTKSIHFVNLSTPLPYKSSRLDIGQKSFQVINFALYGGVFYIYGRNFTTYHLAIASVDDPSHTFTVVQNMTSKFRGMKVVKFDPEESSNCLNSHKCDQLCFPKSENGVTCGCSTGYTLNPDGKSCSAPKNFVMLGVGNTIYGLDNSSFLAFAQLSKIKRAISLDFHGPNNELFWVDGDLNQISKVRPGFNNFSAIVKEQNAQIVCLAVDWIADNLYWSTKTTAGDSSTGLIEVSRLDGQFRKILIRRSGTFAKIIRLDPSLGFMFWLDVSGISRSFLDGSEPIFLVPKANISYFALDLIRKSICILADGVISCRDYSGEHQLSILHESNDEHPKFFNNFDVNDGLLYFSSNPNGHKHGSLVNNRIGRYKLSYESRNKQMITELQILVRNVTSTISSLRIFNFDSQTGRKCRQKNCNPCRYNNGGCEQLCLYIGSSSNGSDHHVCKCSFSKLNNDSKTCGAYDAFLIYSTVQGLDFAAVSDFSSFDSISTAFPPIVNRTFVRNVIGLAYDYKRRRIFYSDIQLGSINVIYLNMTNKTYKIRVLANGQGSVEGLAFDYLHDDLYWTSYSNASIYRSSVGDGTPLPLKSPTKILQFSSHDKPRGVVVDPCDMRIYWTNWNEMKPSVERAFLSGDGRQSIITTNVKTPNGLTIDFKARKLYWSDARLDKIERCDLDGKNRVIVASGQPNHPFGLVVYKDYLYWTDWILRAVVRVNKFTGGDFTLIRKNLDRQPMGLVIAAENSSSCDIDECTKGYSKKCQDYCTMNERGEAMCHCFADRKLLADNSTCEDTKQTCSLTTQFSCPSSSGLCLPYEAVCDSFPDCPKGEDESPALCGATFARRSCRHGFFKCSSSGLCKHESLKCDGKDDCGDFSDETVDCVCNNETQFQCLSGMCIDLKFRCDLIRQCNDASDEIDCPQSDCSSQYGQISCNRTSQCISSSWVCDGKSDCFDNSDEGDCKGISSSHQCSPKSFRCGNTLNDQCIPTTWVCDDQNDCEDGSDEKNCPKKDCDQTNEFKCQNGDCIKKSWLCDGMTDCQNGEDEMGCNSEDNSTKCTGHLCPNGRCILNLYVCDGKNDCKDENPGSDEKNCSNLNQSLFCYEDEFKCANGRCINNLFYCDAMNDCGDDSDEPEGCIYTRCNDQEFRCDNERCVPKENRCNGKDECRDGSDERRCSISQISPPISCKSDQYECCNKVCVDESLLCDRRDDCGDWSDETAALCSDDPCKTAPCAQRCVKRRRGYQCACDDGYKLADDKKNCVDIDECRESFPCSQICLNRLGSFECKCVPGYHLTSDKKTCKHDLRSSPILILSTGTHIWHYDMARKGAARLVMAKLTNVVALDYDHREKFVYFADVTHNGSRIGRTKFESDVIQDLHVIGLGSPEGLAVDFLGRNLYWSDKKTRTIEVSRLDGKFRKILLKVGLITKPRALAIEPYKKYLFWSDWGDAPHIGRMFLDGSDPKKIVTKSLKWPNALTVDFTSKFIFWADAYMDYIAMADYNGQNTRYVLQSPTVDHAFSLSVFEQNLYWVDWEKNQVEWCHKFSGSNRTQKHFWNFGRAKALKVVHPALQASNPNLTAIYDFCVKKCPNLCLLSPIRIGNSKQPYVCKCAENFVKIGQYNCVPDCKPSEFTCTNTYKCLPFWWKCDGQDDCGDGGEDEYYFAAQSCRTYRCKTTGQMQCYDGQNCIDPAKICDGKNDCADGSDEGSVPYVVNCKTYQCYAGQFKCQNSSKCIESKYPCDGRPDCPSGEDEIDCLPKTCPPNFHKCAGSRPRCVPETFICDQQPDCSDGSDEPPDCTKRRCLSSQFRCWVDGKCIPNDWTCDKQNDCADGSDEIDCGNQESRTCKAEEFRCDAGRCLPRDWLCDGDVDCADGSDENDCNGTTTSATACRGANVFACGDGSCVPKAWVCDNKTDCGNGADETLTACDRNLTCTKKEFLCSDGQRCVDRALVCNGLNDCSDGSDETASASCYHGVIICNEESNFQCSSGGCIQKSWVCDGEEDCQDGSDEIHCNKTCTRRQFQCQSDKNCINSLFLCDGFDDCGDKSDENLKLCLRRPCAPNFAKCANGKCYPAHLSCDGVKHCSDGSDESENLCQTERKKHCDFRCENGHCISSSFRCDSFDHCGDFSDEKDCSLDKCQEFGTCSQKCQISRKNSSPKCFCEEGYEQEWWNTKRCRATGKPPLLLVASHDQIFSIDPHNLQHYDKIFGAKSPNLRIESMDFYRLNQNRHQKILQNHIFSNESQEFLLFFVNRSSGDGQSNINGLILSTKNLRFSNQIRRNERSTIDEDEEEILTFVDKIDKPKSLAFDWLHSHIYWTQEDPASIWVAKLGENVSNILVMENLHEPGALAVSPEAGHLFWTDMGGNSGAPKIECSNLAGRDRKILVNKNLILPTGLSIDIPNRRLYWSDPKTSSIETINFDGSDRRLVKSFAFVSSVCSRNLSSCPVNSLCLPTNDQNFTCLCSRGFKFNEEKFTCQENTNFSPACKIQCLNGGKCRKIAENEEICVDCKVGFTGRYCQIHLCHKFCLNEGICTLANDAAAAKGFIEPYCRCPIQYDGPRCERYKCTDYCRHGVCYIDRSNFLPRCLCDADYGGERCEKRKQHSEDPCADRCYNNGTCFVTPYGLPICECPRGLDGMRCEKCSNLECLNGGICLGHGEPGRETCLCKASFEGRRCEVDLCKGYCHHGQCSRVGSGHALKCDCPARYAGPKCSVDRCEGLCRNEGVCIEQPESKNVACVCPPSFYGVFCEKRHTCRDYCRNNGTCLDNGDSLSCKCPADIGGDRCERLDCPFCRNGAQCTKIDQPKSSPVLRLGHLFVQCRCPLGLAGQFCDRYDDAKNRHCSSHLRCVHGLCHKPAGAAPRCLCRAGWRGLVCNLPSCYNYCLNDGLCEMMGEKVICKCKSGSSGNRCQRLDENSTNVSSASTENETGFLRFALILFLPLCVLVLLGGFIFYAIFHKWRRLDVQFRHNRMRDDQILQNPSFLSGSEDDLSAFEAEGTNFTNPLYDNVYNDTVVNTSNEEHEPLAKTKNGEN